MKKRKGRPNSLPLTEAQRKRIVERRRAGATLSSLADQYGISQQAVYQIAGRIGQSIRPYPAEKREEYLAMRAAGETQRAAAAALGIGRATGQRWERG